MKEYLMDLIKVNKSLSSMYDMAYSIADEKNIFWFVTRDVNLIKFDIRLEEKSSHGADIFFNRVRVIVNAYHIIDKTQIMSNVKIKLGLLYNDYSVQGGHFFFTKNAAMNYMYQRILYINNESVSKAKEYLNTYPEYLI